jgi:hypothetical protein
LIGRTTEVSTVKLTSLSGEKRLSLKTSIMENAFMTRLRDSPNSCINIQMAIQIQLILILAWSLRQEVAKPILIAEVNELAVQLPQLRPILTSLIQV